MKSRNAWIVYTLLRLAFFVVPFALLMILLPLGGMGTWPTIFISVGVAALISVSLSVIFLARSREAAAESIYEWRNRERTADDLVEDEAVDASSLRTPEPDPSSNEGSDPETPRH